MNIRENILFSLIFLIFINIGLIFSDRFENHCVYESIISENPQSLYNNSFIKPELQEESLISLNTASIEDLSGLPGINIKLSQRIIAFREENGDFEVIEDIMKVPGIGEKKFHAIKEYITVK